jgi:hypothetical protein
MLRPSHFAGPLLALVLVTNLASMWQTLCQASEVELGLLDDTTSSDQLSSSRTDGYPLPTEFSDFESGGPQFREMTPSAGDPAQDDLVGSGTVTHGSKRAMQTTCFADEGLFENLSLMTGIEGSKQPQDFGVNAAIGGRVEVNWGIPVYRPLGIGLQLGTATVASDNAVRVFELLNEDANRYQQYVTFGAFQRLENTFAYGLVYDFLYQDSFDTTTLGQWRGRASYRPWTSVEIGSTINLRSFGDDATFGSNEVRLRTIDQMSIYSRRYFQTGVQGSVWFGIADEHGESNAVTGPSPATDEAFLLGADVLAPLSSNFAIYGETNLIMPSDTGTVDAFMAIAWYPWGNARRARRTAYAPLLPMAASTSFAVDLLPN